MAPSALRSFTIALAIVIAIIEPKASGFTIYTSTERAESNDPITDHSTQLQVVNDLRRPNNTGKDEGDALKQTRDSGKGISNEDKYTDRSLPLTEGKTRASIDTTTESLKTTEFVKAPTILSDTIEVFDSVEDVTENNAGKKHVTSTSIPKHTEKVFSTQNSPVTVIKYTTTITEIRSKTSTPEYSTVTEQILTETEPAVNGVTKQEIMSSVIDSNNMSTEAITIELSTVSNTSSSGTKFPSSITKDTIPANSDFSATISAPSPISYLSNETKVISSSLISITDTTTHGIDQTINKTSTEPSSNKYTNIERKRVTSAEVMPITKTEHETMQADTSNSHVEKSYGLTQTQDLVPNAEQMMYDETAKVTVGIDSMIPSLNTIKSEGAKRAGIIEDKRGGFLDFSEKVTTPFANEVVPTERQYTDAPDPIMDRETPEIQKLKKENSSASQSRLAEDARHEELLKEEAFYNQKDNERNEKRIKPLDEGKTKADVGTESSVDSLSVQPINYERTKTTLYTISPNYKPMKKIDVQPAKPFIRDPDDNSWRNESISSLGIVFKPKNASKSFKEVLKNKTQVELNNLQEKDSKEDLPDLRERLEKIAEVRKTKRKKIIRDGEEVYTDYEEASAENNRDTSTTPGFISPGLTPAITSSTEPRSTSVRPEVDLTSPATTIDPFDYKTEKTMSKLDLFQSLGLKTLTTDRAKKMFNIAEYYDTTDDYDADYVTMSKIDIKKQLATTRATEQTPATTPPATEQPAAPPRPQFPARRPTVQYFPPRPTQRVSLNNIDADFERKVNMFAIKEGFAPAAPHWMSADDAELTTRPARPSLYDIEFTPRPPPALSRDTLPPHHTTEDHFDRGSYVIKHFRDFLQGEEAGPEPPPRAESDAADEGPDFDYDVQFRKDAVSRFVDNFNANSERFRAEFPVLYSSSVRHAAGGGQSRALLRRPPPAACAPPCRHVPLAPAYELHYDADDPPPPRNTHDRTTL